MSEGLEKLKLYFNNEIPLSRPQGLKIVSSIEDYIEMLEDRIDNLETSYLRNRKALEIIKVLFQGRYKLYEQTEYTETCNEEGCHAEKIATTAYILEFHNYDLHYEFHLHKEEYDLLKEELL